MRPFPLLIAIEQIWSKRKDWILEPRELAEDGFWVPMDAFLKVLEVYINDVKELNGHG